MYGERQRRVKTDQRDVRALVTACRHGHYRRAHRVSGTTRALRQELRVRRHLVQMRTQTINVLRALLRQEGLRLPSGDAAAALARLARLELPAALARVLDPLQTWLATLQTLLAHADARVTTTATADPVAQSLMSVPGVGPVIALTYRAVLDTPARFGNDPGRASAFLGLVPSEVQLRRSAAPRSHHQTGATRTSRAARASELGRVARAQRGECASPRLGSGACPTARPPYRHCGAGAPLESHPACRVARRDRFHAGSPAREGVGG